MRQAFRRGWISAALLAAGACATAPPAPDRLAAMSVAVVARLEEPPVSRLHATEGAPEGAAADRRLEARLAACESSFASEVRFRGELLDGFGVVPPFRVVSSARVDSLRGSLLVQEAGPPDYDNLGRAGVSGVLELTVRRVELVAAGADRPAGLRVEARARFVDLAGGGETWSRDLTLEPRAGGPLAFDPAEAPEELERRYLAALDAAARELGRATARAFAGPARLP